MHTDKIVTLAELLEHSRVLRQSGKRIVSTNGCFDLLHVGHIRNLEEAKRLGDVLIVGVNSDTSVRHLKGETRPIITERERAEMLAALRSVDFVLIFEEPTPFSWIEALRPDVHVKGGGEDVRVHPDFAAQKELVESFGGKLVLVPHHDGISTSAILSKIRAQ